MLNIGKTRFSLTSLQNSQQIIGWKKENKTLLKFTIFVSFRSVILINQI